MALYTTNANGNWSGAIWTPAAPTGGPGNGDTIQVNHNLTIDSAAGALQNGAVTIGRSPPIAPTAAPTVAATGGGGTTSLPTGAYIVSYSNVDTNGVETIVTATAVASTWTNGVSTPLITLPARPTGIASRNIYITNTGGAGGTEHRYATGITGTTVNPTSASWENGTLAYASAVAVPAANTVNAITMAAAKSLGGNAGCSLRLRGLMLAGNGACTDTYTGPFTVTFDSSQAADPPSTSYSYPISNLRILNFNGSANNLVVFTSDNSNSAANGAIQPAAGGSQSGRSQGQFFRLVNLGSATVNCVNANLNGPGDTMSWSDFTVENCGQVNCIVAHATSVMSFVRGIWSGSLVNETSTYTLNYNPTAAMTGGTRLIDECQFDKKVKANAASSLSVTASSGKGCVFGNGVLWGSTSDCTTFDGALVRWTSPGLAAMGWPGQFTNSFLYIDSPVAVNAHGIDILAGLTATSNIVNWLKSIFYFNGTDSSGNLALIDNEFAATTTCNVRFNLFLPNSGGSGNACFASTSNLTTPRFNCDHNTFCVEGQWGLEIGHLQTVVESPNRWLSVGGNLFFGATSNGYKCDNVDSTTALDLIPPAVADYNGDYKVKQISGLAFATNEGKGYISKWSATPGIHDVNLDASGGPLFVNSAASMATWDTSMGGPGTEAHALASLLAGTAGYTVAALVAYLRAAYRPQNPLLTGVTGTLDAAQSYTTDAAGNALAGTVGAMAYSAGSPTPTPTGTGSGGEYGGVIAGIVGRPAMRPRRAPRR